MVDWLYFYRMGKEKMYITRYALAEHPFGFQYQVDSAEKVENSKMHYHGDVFEILYMISGNCSYMVEGKRYKVSAGDIVFTRPDEIHMMIHELPKTEYKRVVFSVPGKFFVRHRCEALKAVFTNRKPGVDNLIPASSAVERDIPRIIMDMKRYCEENAPEQDIIMSGKLIELLYNLNKAVPEKDSLSYFANDKIKEVIGFINEHLNYELSLDFLADKYYISKGHLCQLFKEQTGMTVNKYITHKRLLKVQELYVSGYTLLNASHEAGFGDYSTFHRMYVKEFGVTPKAGMGQLRVRSGKE